MDQTALDAYTARMPSKRYFKPKPLFLRRLLQTRRLPQQTVSAVLLVLIWALVSGLLTLLPGLWVARRQQTMTIAFYNKAHDIGHVIIDRWSKAPWVPEFRNGDEPALRASLDQDPLVRALVDLDQNAVWVRERNRMVRAKDEQEVLLFKTWARKAQDSGQPTSVPSFKGDPWALEESNLLVPAGKYWAVKTWRPGSQEVERFLRLCLGLHARMRFGIMHWSKTSIAEQIGSRTAISPPPPDSLQIWTDTPWAQYECLGTLFGDAWTVGISMTPDEAGILRRSVRRWRYCAWACYALTVVLSGLGLLLYLHARHRERLEADRLASLTHSLKTPLAILKLRCDTARNPTLPRAKQEAYLASIGDEVDQLVQVIEAGLEAIRPKLSRPPLDHIDRDFFARLVEDLSAAFEDANRSMDLNVQSPEFLANEQALHAALATLLENALLHGQGAVDLRVHRSHNLVAIQVRDQGPGVRLDHLDRIFGGQDRRRNLGKPIEARRSQGLGLFLLAQLAEREGWGLIFQSEPGLGFSAVVEIRQ
jgi:signal transduction histidine kinase